MQRQQTTTPSGSPAGLHQSLGKRAKSIQPPGAPTAKSARFELKRTAARALFDADLGTKQRFRVVHCGRSMHGDWVFVRRSAGEAPGARFSGLVTCGSGWTCPVCCMKVAEARRKELTAGLVWHVKSGGYAYLFTYTAPHVAETMLADTLERFRKARAGVKNSAAYKGAGQATARLGSVCSAEVTFGVNGWHPHLHEIFFCRRLLDQEDIEKLKASWVHQLLKAGLGDEGKRADMLLHGLDVRGGEEAAAYITKYGREETWGIPGREETWGLASELTRQHTKEGRGDHVTPFGLLALAVAGESAPGARDPRLLFREFADATLDKRLMTFSPGLRAALQLGVELTDAQLADEPLPDEAPVGKLDADQWKMVLSRNAESELLDFAARMCVDEATGQSDLDDFVRWLAHRPKLSHGWFRDGMRPRYG